MASWADVRELDKTGNNRTPEEAKRIIVDEEAALKASIKEERSLTNLKITPSMAMALLLIGIFFEVKEGT